MDTKKEKDTLHTEKEITSKTSIGPTSFGPRMTGEAAAKGEGTNRAAAAREEALEDGTELEHTLSHAYEKDEKIMHPTTPVKETYPAVKEITPDTELDKEYDKKHDEAFEKEPGRKTSIGATSFGPRMTGEAAAEGEGTNRAAAARQEEKLDKKP